jgi:hypothetical protein
MDSENIFDLKSLIANHELRNLTVEEAIRLLGDKEKSAIMSESERIAKEFRLKIRDKENRK